MLRIISGKYRNRKIQTLDGIETRPTAERAREAVFSSLQSRLIGAHFLDLFAGSGAIGIEALSRGAAEAVFVECAPDAVKLIKANLLTLGLEAEVISSPVVHAIESLRDTFDIVFLDPPYKEKIIGQTLEALKSCKVLSEDAVIVIEHENGLELPEGFVLQKEKQYGKAKMTFLSLGVE